MTLDDLRYFVEAAATQHLSQAARTLAVTQSAVSHAVKRLEDELDAKLFVKEGRSLKLTPAGRVFAERAAKILEDVGVLRRDVAGGVGGLPRRFRVGATLGAPARLFAAGWHQAAFTRDRALHLLSLRSSDVVQRVSKGELELGFCLAPQPFPAVVAHRVATTETVVACRAGHPLLALADDERYAALDPYPYASAAHLPGVGTCTSHPVFARFAREVKPALMFDSYDVATEMLRYTDGWAVLPRAIVKATGGLLTEVRPELTERLELVLIHHESEPYSGVIGALLDSLRAACRGGGWEA